MPRLPEWEGPVPPEDVQKDPVKLAAWEAYWAKQKAEWQFELEQEKRDFYFGR